MDSIALWRDDATRCDQLMVSRLWSMGGRCQEGVGGVNKNPG
ncbi:MAG: hypothetical protein ACRC5D_17255 [Aeromonas allosaccharophila]